MHGFNLKSFDLSEAKMYATTIHDFQKTKLPCLLS